MIRVRRPPTVRVVDEPFVPDGLPPGEVDRRWNALCAANPRVHDGRLLHVLGVHRNGAGGATIHVVECAYRFYAINVLDGNVDTRVRPLGVKGITTRAVQGRDGAEILLGRRAEWVASDAGRWELAPGGAVEPGWAPEVIVRDELREETGLVVPASAITALAIAFDPSARSWEIVHRIQVAPDDDCAPSGNGEYDELRWWPVADAPPTPMGAIGARLWAMATERSATMRDMSDGNG